MKSLLFTLALLTGTIAVQAQTPDSSTTANADRANDVRTQSGIDPTRVTSRVGYSAMYYLQSEGRAQINNRLSANLGVGRWNFALKTDLVSVNTVPGGGFATGLGDLYFTVLNAFYVHKRVALAGSVEFGLPTASSNIKASAGMGGYFYATPALTFSYTINPTLMFAVQPQYSFSLAKNALYPDMNTFTTRIFLAKFTPTGWFFVLEARPIVDLNNGAFDFIVSPIVGKSLGKGYNLVLLSEVPTKRSTIDNRGVMFQLGFNKSF